ncbi:MAG: DUF2294 domain-containing protein [Thermoanaerobacteraceae bacterium]
MIYLFKSGLESKINEEMIKLIKEITGRGAQASKTRICDDMIIVRLSKTLTHEEMQLVSTEEGKRLVRELRAQLDAIVRPKFEKMILEITGAKVVSLYKDISVKKGEYIYVFILDKNLEEELKNR